MKKSQLNRQKYLVRYVSLGQWGFSLTELLVYSGVLVLLFLGTTQFLLDTNKVVTTNRNRVLSTQWSQEIIEHLITEPECVSPSCLSVTSSCTNTIAGFDNTSDGETEYTALYVATKDNLPASKIYTSVLDSEYDTSKHLYSGLQITKITVIAGDRDQKQATLRIVFNSTHDINFVSSADLSIYIHEYQSDEPTLSNYSKVKRCSIVGTVFQGTESLPCYTLDDSDDSVDTNEGRALVGCGGTHQIQKSQTTAYGYAAGKNNTGAGNTFIGYSAGISNTTGQENTFVGYEAGKSSSTVDNNTFIGYRAAYDNQASNNTFVGHSAGFSNKGGSNNTFIGYASGKSNIGASNNTFIGHSAGFSNTIGYENTFIGKDSGLNIDSGNENVFIGYKAAGNSTVLGSHTASYNTTFGAWSGADLQIGTHNVLLGVLAGKQLTSGSENVLIGTNAGMQGLHMKGNVVIGQNAGLDTGKTGSDGHYNIMIGPKVGRYNTTGSYNIFMDNSINDNQTGRNNIYILKKSDWQVKMGISTTADNQFNIGNLIAGKLPTSSSDGTPLSELGSNEGVIIHGKLTVTGDLIFKNKFCDATSTSLICLKECSSTPPSSRVYKKNIQPFIDYASALKDIESTSLFYYEYKHDHPDKKRMGVISEELPEHLQIRDKGASFMPDWVSIYGTLWAGIKALSLELNLLKEEFSQLVKKTHMELVQQWESQQMVLKKQLIELKLNMSQWHKKWRVYELQTEENFQQSQSEIQTLSQELEHIEGLLKRNKNGLKKFHSISKELRGAKDKLVAAQNALQKAQGSLEKSHNRLKKLEEQIR